MGDRINFYFKQDDISPTVKLYSHSGGFYAKEKLSAALLHAKPRWNDPEYGTRMIINHIIGDYTMGELGYGISAEKPGYFRAEENGYYIIDFQNKAVQFVGPYGDYSESTFEYFTNSF